MWISAWQCKVKEFREYVEGERRKQQMEEENKEYIRFFAIWFLLGFFLGILLLVAASHFGVEKGSHVRLFQIEAFLGRSISGKDCFSYLLRVRMAPAAAGIFFGLTPFGVYFAIAAVLAYGFLYGVFLTAAWMQNGPAGFGVFFLSLFPQIFFYLAALFQMAVSCSRMAEIHHLAGGMQRKEYIRFGIYYFFALVLLLWGILLESYVNPFLLQRILRI